MRLYQIRGCPFAHRARIVLEEKKLPYEVTYYEPKKRPPELDAVSAEARSPTLFDGDDRVWESSVVIEYLDEKYPQAPRLMPQDAAARARVRLAIKETEGKVVPTVSPIVQELVYKPKDQPKDAARIEDARVRFVAAVSAFQARLEAHDYVAGADFTLADIVLFTQVRSVAELLGLAGALPDIPAIRAWYARIDARPSTAYERELS